MLLYNTVQYVVDNIMKYSTVRYSVISLIRVRVRVRVRVTYPKRQPIALLIMLLCYTHFPFDRGLTHSSRRTVYKRV